MMLLMRRSAVWSREFICIRCQKGARPYGDLCDRHHRIGTMVAHSEHKERLARPLIRLARLAGVATSYVGQTGDYHEIGDEVLVEVLAALGIDASSAAAIDEATNRMLDERLRRLVPPTVLHMAGERQVLLVRTEVHTMPHADIVLENGMPFEGRLRWQSGDGSAAYPTAEGFLTTAGLVLPADLPLGYHTLRVRVGERVEEATLISAPRRVPMLDAMKQGQLWGWMAQLYSVRSSQSWGVGDFEDLATMLSQAKSATGADFMLVNPLHAAEPVSPLTPSPYLPISRRFVNVTYIRPERVAEYLLLSAKDRQRIEQLHEQVDALNGDAQLIDRDAMWNAKREALWIVFRSGMSDARRLQFQRYCESCGDELESYATWCLCVEQWGMPDGSSTDWAHRYGKDSAPVKALRERFAEHLEFYRWLEWIAVEQLRHAQHVARQSGMRIGIMADMAVGVHPCGSDVWWHPERFAKGATVGAPPDYFNQQGQDWSQPPLHPMELERTGYRVYRDMVHDMFAQAGAVRIDHILGLFRLWWIPQGRGAADGAYVHYNAEAMLGILALEASRAGGVVVGEDLGVVPDYVQESLREHGVLGCTVEWFEQHDGRFVPPSQWREYALASVNTHDMPPAAGYLAYEHVAIRERLHLLTCSTEEFMSDARREHRAMMAMLVEQGFLDAAALEDESVHGQQIVEALYRALKASPCKLLAASLVDAVGERRAQNQPGTNNEYPNWRVPLADAHGDVVPLESLFSNERLRSLSAIMRGE